MSREEKINQANEIADSINRNFKDIKNSKYGRFKLVGLDSLSVIAGLTVGGVSRALDLDLNQATPFIIGFALQNLIVANTFPRPNRLSNIADYETIKYLMGAITPCA